MLRPAEQVLLETLRELRMGSESPKSPFLNPEAIQEVTVESNRSTIDPAAELDGWRTAVDVEREPPSHGTPGG